MEADEKNVKASDANAYDDEYDDDDDDDDDDDAAAAAAAEEEEDDSDEEEAIADEILDLNKQQQVGIFPNMYKQICRLLNTPCDFTIPLERSSNSVKKSQIFVFLLKK